jgi:hypothetical protein
LEPNVKMMGFPPVAGAKNADGVRGDGAVKDSASLGLALKAATIFGWVATAAFSAVSKPESPLVWPRKHRRVE